METKYVKFNIFIDAKKNSQILSYIFYLFFSCNLEIYVFNFQSCDKIK